MVERASLEPVLPLLLDEFAGLLEPCLPCGRPAALAVAVSGGADSMALTLLLNDWLRVHGGRLLALTVDHGLRPESRAEAALLTGWLLGCGIRLQICRWRPAAGNKCQAKAREARYQLMADACRKAGSSHLLLGHHLDDQVETMLQRLARGSASDGLAGMSAVSARDGLTLLRPLLSVPKARLLATVEQRAVPWIEDPSNRDAASSRVRVRRDLAAAAGRNIDAEGLAGLVRQFGRARALLERQTLDLLARAAVLEPAGYLRLALEPLQSAPPQIAGRALARCLVTIGGGEHAPRSGRLARLQGAVLNGLGAAATLGGCLIIPRPRELLIAREPGRAAPLAVGPGQTVRWDGRFELRLSHRAVPTGSERRWQVGCLGESGWIRVRAHAGRCGGLGEHWPHPVRQALPALWEVPDGRSEKPDPKLLAVPPLEYYDEGLETGAVEVCRFAPRRPLLEPPFTVV